MPSRTRTSFAALTAAAVCAAVLLPAPAFAAPAAGSAGAGAVAPSASVVADAPALVVTEIVPDNVGYDDFEFFEVHNTTDAAIDLDAAGIGFAYIYDDSDDASRDVPLTTPAGTVVGAGETVVLWLSYQTSTVDSFAHDEDDFRAYFAETQPRADYDVVRVEGQSGMANGGGRGIRVADAGGQISRSFYPAGSAGTDLGVTFRLPHRGAAMEVLTTQAAPTPGVLDEGTLVPADAPETEPLAARELVITEFAPNNLGTDAYEYVEIANTTDRDIDLADSDVTIVYDYVSGSKPLHYPAGSIVPAGGIAVLWLTYSPNTDGLTDADFRAFYGTTSEYEIIPVTNQSGFANGGDRGVRLESGDAVVSAAWYLPGQVGDGLGVDYRLPAAAAETDMAVLRELAEPTPGTVDAEAFVPEPFTPTPDPDLVTAPLQVTEIAPDTANVGEADGYEFIEVYNATSEPIDFRDYSLKYLYPLADLSNSSTTLWPATQREAMIAPGGTIVFWIKNGPNDDLTDADFNAHFGSALVAGETLFEIESAGMANGSPRGIEIVTNTGFGVNRAYWNLGGVDDTTADMPIQYAVDRADTTMQTKLGIAAATPGAVAAEQVEPGLMIVPGDEQAPQIVDETASEIDPTADFTMSFAVTDETQVKTVWLDVRSDLDERPTRYELVTDGSDGYSYTVKAVDLTGKDWYEYVLTARDGTNEVSTEVRRVEVAGAQTEPVRLNLEDGAWVSGDVDVVAGTDTYPSEVELSVDGTVAPTTAQLEDAPVFAFEASGVDTFFRNGVLVGDDILRIFDDGIYEGWETIATDVPLSYVTGRETVTVSVWAGTKAAPEIDPDENNDDFEVRNLRMILPDGRTLAPAGYSDPTTVLRMGDSAGKLDYYDAVFTIPADANTAAGYRWDTTAVADGAHEVRAVAGDAAAAASVVVDNTAPAVTSELVAGTRYQGEFVIDADATDAGSGLAELTASLDGDAIELPYATSSLRLADGEHEAVFTATDVAGNTATLSVPFTTPVEEPGNELITPEDGAEFADDEEIELTARATDPTGDRLDVSFREADRLAIGDGIEASTGAVSEAATTDRSGARALTAEEAELIGRFDERSLSEASAAGFPYQLFDVAVPPDADADSRVRVRWDGSANADAKVLLYALGVDGAWHELDRYLTTGGAPTSFTLEAVVPVSDYATDGGVRMLVQHSEGFAGDDLSSRESAVEPNNVADTPRSEYDFTLAWESDTQYYNEEFVQHQAAIHDYLLRERADLNLQYLFHTGDIVDNFDEMYQWHNADPEYAKLDEAGLPYGVLAGNHDVGQKDNDYTNYSEYFGAHRYQDNAWWGGDYLDNRGHYDLITAGGIDFVMLYMGWGPGDDEIAWMNEVLAQYPERIAVINLHEYMLTTGGLGPIPQRIYDEVVAANANVRMVFSGHYHDAYTRIDTFDDDGDGTAERTVHQMLFDYQGLPEGGQGFLRLLHFDNDGGRMLVRTYSPSYDVYNSDDPSLDMEHQEFTVSYADLGINVAEKMLATDAFSAEILSGVEIAGFDDVESGAELTATWAPGLGAHGWYVSSVDPYGATADSEVRVLSVVEASEQPGDGDPGDGDPGDGEDPGDGPGEGPGDGGGEGAPAAPSVPVATDDLDPALEGAITAPATVRVGDPIAIGLERADGTWAQVWLHSTPTPLGGWTQVSGGIVRAVIPATVEPRVHTLVVQDEAGVVGWTTIRVLPAPGDAVIGDPADAGGTRDPLATTGTDAAWTAPAALAAGMALLAGILLLTLPRIRRLRRRA